MWTLVYLASNEMYVCVSYMHYYTVNLIAKKLQKVVNSSEGNKSPLPKVILIF
jgi:hypothetical protein